MEQRIKAQAIADGMSATLADLILAQAKHETGNFTSAVFKANNNLFGYKFVGQKIATRGTPAPANEGSNMFYAKYKTIEDSVKELTSWLKRRQAEGKGNLNTITNAKQYATFLQSGSYFTDGISNYIKGLQRWFGTDAKKKPANSIVCNHCGNFINF